MTLVMLVAARRSWGAGACARRARTPMFTLRQLVTKPPRSRESTDVIQRAEQHITDDGDDDGNDDPGGEYNHQAQLEHPKLTRRMDAIRTLHARQAQLQAELAQRIMQLEAECEEKLAPLYDRRAEIVSGASEPTDAEAKPLEEYVAVEPDLALEDAEPGIPGFWLAALTNHHTVGDQITEEDAAVLDHLVDVRSERFGTPAAEGEVAMTPEEQGFRLVFRFAPNPYFADAELVKTVWMDEGFPARAQGMAIQWKEGMDVTHKVVAKVSKKKKKMVKTRERQPSFFHFFHPDVLVYGDELDEMDRELGEDGEDGEGMQADLEDMRLALAFKEELIPDAIEFVEADVDEMDEDEDEF